MQKTILQIINTRVMIRCKSLMCPLRCDAAAGGIKEGKVQSLAGVKDEVEGRSCEGVRRRDEQG